MRTQVNTSPCVRESRFWNPRNFCPWNLGYGKFYLRNPKSWALESEIQLKVSWIPPTMGHFRVPPTLTFKMRLGAQPFLWKWVLFAWEWKMISISKTEHLPSFSNRGPGELGNGLFGLISSSSLYSSIGSFYVSVKLPAYPSPKPTFCPK